MKATNGLEQVGREIEVCELRQIFQARYPLHPIAVQIEGAQACHLWELSELGQ